MQPDPRTYQETEIHILFDKAEEMCEPDEKSSTSHDNYGFENDTNGIEGQRAQQAKLHLQSRVSPASRMSCPPIPLTK